MDHSPSRIAVVPLPAETLSVRARSKSTPDSVTSERASELGQLRAAVVAAGGGKGGRKAVSFPMISYEAEGDTHGRCK